MYDFLNVGSRRVVRDALAALLRHSLIMPWALLIGFGAVFAALAAAVGLAPLPFALDFMGDAAASLAAPVTKLWLSCYVTAAFCFGIGKGLPELMQHRSLSARAAALYTQSLALWTASAASNAAHFEHPQQQRIAFARPSRTAMSTPSDLAGSAPRLE